MVFPQFDWMKVYPAEAVMPCFQEQRQVGIAKAVYLLHRIADQKQ